MIPLFHAVILDIVVVSILLIIIVTSVVKGFMHTLINFLLLSGSIALGFAPFMMVVKKPIVDLLSSKIVLGAGIGDELKLGIYLLYPFIAALGISLVIYFILRLVKLLICNLVKRSKLKDNKLPSRLGKVSRIAGGFTGLVLYGVIVIVALSIFAHPLVGGDKTLKEGYVARHIERADDYVLELVADKSDGEQIQGQIVLRLLLGDFYSEVKEQSIEDLNVLSEIVVNKGLEVESLDDITAKMKYFYHFLRFTKTHMLDDKGVEVDGFEKVIEQTRMVSNKIVGKITTLHGAEVEPIKGVKNVQAIVNYLEDLGLKDSAVKFKEIFVNS